jgi:NAD(P)-dependent dehydrogenase (short-subunit alcohol dehydrogenase family)
MSGLRHEDKVVIVTGAAIGNGQAIAKQFAREGAHVVIADIADAGETLSMIEEVSPKHPPRYIETDITKEEATRLLTQTMRSDYERIDVLVNNAGVYDEEPFELLTFAEWKKVMGVNLDGLFLMTKAVLPSMKAQNFGRIINMSSNTIWLGTPYLVHYVASKMGVVGFTRALASEVAQYGITVNAITVGLTATQRPNGDDQPSGNILAHLYPSVAYRPETPEDLAELVAFLASEKSAMITGQAINVDGGVARH